ncbi:hypothetical protein [Bacillus sp. AK031]
MNLTHTRRTLLFSFLAAILITGCSSEDAASDNQQEQSQTEQEEPAEQQPEEDTSDEQSDQASDGDQSNQDDQSAEDDQPSDEDQSNQDDQEQTGDESQQNDSDENMSLTKDEAAEVLSEYEDTFMVKTNEGTVENYNTKEELLSHFKTIMSEQLAQSYLDDFFRMQDGELMMVATEPPVWLNSENEYQYNKENDSTYHVVQSKSSELRGEREYTFELAYADEGWIVDDVSSVKSGQLSKAEAEDLVREYLGNEIEDSTIVEYDHMEQEQYVIHVYDQVEDGEGSHTATIGWYKVDPVSEEITSLFDDDQGSSQQIKEKANQVLDTILNKDMDALASYVHPEKGLLISPYVNISDEDVVFEKQEVAKLFEMNEAYTWGYQDGSGKPMKSTPQEYFQRYQEFSEVDKVIVDNLKQRGNVELNIKEYFPESHVVEFYKNGTEENSNMDWSSLYVVFQQDGEGEWKAVALVSGQWTV